VQYSPKLSWPKLHPKKKIGSSHASKVRQPRLHRSVSVPFAKASFSWQKRFLPTSTPHSMGNRAEASPAGTFLALRRPAHRISRFVSIPTYGMLTVPLREHPSPSFLTRAAVSA